MSENVVTTVVTPGGNSTTQAAMTGRRRGRPRIYPRDEQGNVIKPISTPKVRDASPEQVNILDDSLDSDHVGIIPAKRATRGKKPARFQLDESSEEEGGEGDPASAPAKKRGRPPKTRPPAENNGNPDVTVNISVRDRACTQYLGLMGVYILYYCRRCAFSSKHMSDIIEHIKTGEHLDQPAEAMETVITADDQQQQLDRFISEPLVTEALTSVANEDLKNIVALNNAEKPQKFVKVEEHDYAEVTVEKPPKPVVLEAEEEEEPEEEIVSDDSTHDPDFNAGTVSSDGDDDVIDDEDELDDAEDEAPVEKKRGRKRKRVDTDATVEQDETLDSDLEEDPLVPRRYKCSRCFYTVFHSLTDYREHRKCHGGSGPMLHCYACRLAGKKKILGGAHWDKLRSHLAVFHNVNFQLHCPACPELLSSHARFLRHYKTHLHSCSHEFCRYDSAKPEDMELHQRCHQEANVRYFSCAICGYNSKNKPWKWSLIHTHLLSKHPGTISAVYTCRTCGDGFFDRNAYIDHKRSCGKDVHIRCDLCGRDVLKASFMKHAVWHVKNGLSPEAEDDMLPPVASDSVEGQSVLIELETVETPEAAAEVTEIDPSESTRAADMLEGATNSEESAVNNNTPVVLSSQKIEVDNETSEIDLPVQDLKTPEEMEGSDGEDVAEVYRCVEHEQDFQTAGELTLHYVHQHWGISEEKMEAAKVAFDRRQQEILEKSRTDREDQAILEQIENMEGWSGTGYERCQHCYKKFTSFQRLHRHIQRCHTSEKLKPVKCPTCQRQFRNRCQLRNHIRIVHEGIKRKKPDIPYKPRKRLFVCELCGYSTPENIRLKNHRLSAHVGVMPYACDQCDYKTNEKSDLRRHIGRHAGIKKHTCQLCPYKTDQRWLLVNHSLRQHDVKLPKVKRNTRGGQWSNRKKVDEIVIGNSEALDYNPIENLISLQAVQDGEEVTVLMAASEDFGETEQEHTIAVESLQDAMEGQQVVYVREDGTILDPQEAAMMLMAQEGGAQVVEEPYEQMTEEPLVIMPDVIQVQETVVDPGLQEHTIQIIEEDLENVITIQE